MQNLHRIVAAAAVAVLAASGCKSVGGSTVKDVASGPTAVRPSWLMSPEAIESTVKDTWGLTVSDEEAQRYFGSVHTLMGGTSVVRRTTLLSKPHELYVLTLDSLSAWVADKLTQKQTQIETQSGKPDQFLFRGFVINGLNVSDKIKDPEQCRACYADDAKPWCDCSDGLTIGSLAAGSQSPTTLAATSTAQGSKAWRKRIMHNMQDIGDFLMCGVGSIDDRTPAQLNGQTVNVAQYLLDDVFLPVWSAEAQAGATGADGERRAWASVVHTILMGQGCFMNLASTQR